MATCEMCGNDMNEDAGCIKYRAHLMTGEVIDAPKHNEEGSLGVGPEFNDGDCPDCAAEYGEYHHPMCDWAQTPEDTKAHSQLLSAVHHIEEL